MSNINWARKLTSRKFWMALAAFVGMLIVYFGGTSTQADQTTALIMAGGAVIAYIIGEGLTDAANAMPEGIQLEVEEIEDKEE